MAVNNTTALSGPYTANGVTTEFPFSFKAQSPADVGVLKQTLNDSGVYLDPNDYSVQVNNGTGGTVTISPALASGTVIYIVQRVSFDQQATFEDGSRWAAKPVNDMNDRAAMRDLFLLRDLRRAIKTPMGEDGFTFPQAERRKGKFLGFDAVTGAVAVVNPPDPPDMVGGVVSPTYPSFASFGGDVAAGDNATAFAAADAADTPVYARGAFHTSVIPQGRYFGPASFTVSTVAGDVTIPLDLSVPIRVNSKVYTNPLTGLKDMRLNFATGPGAGLNWSANSQANVAVGHNSQRLGTDSERAVTMGWGTLEFANLYVDCPCAIGDSSQRFSAFSDRNDSLGSNTLKWGGSQDPRPQGHDYYEAGWAQGPDRTAAWSIWRTYVTEDGTAEGPYKAGTLATNATYKYNVAIGRDTMDHMLQGVGNVAIGCHAFEGFDNNYCVAIGMNANEFAFINNGTIAIGKYAARRKMSGDFDTIIGTDAADNLVHGFNNTIIGGGIAPVLNGQGDDKTLVDQRVYGISAFGANALASLRRGARLAMFGTGHATEALRLEDVAAFGHSTLGNVAFTSNSLALGYRAGQNNRSASFTASISNGSGGAGTTMDVSAITYGPLQPGDPVLHQNVANGTTIVSQTSGTPGGIGVYEVSAPQFLSSTTGILTGLSNVNCIGNYVGGLTKSDTQKIGQQLTDTTIAGRTATTKNPQTVTANSGQTLTISNILEALLTRTGPVQAFADTTPSAADIIATLAAPEVGTSFTLRVTNDSVAPMNLAGGVGVTGGAIGIGPGYIRDITFTVKDLTTPTVDMSPGATSLKTRAGSPRVIAASGVPVTLTAAANTVAALAEPIMPAAALGPNGFVDVEGVFTHTNNANVKQLAVYLGTTGTGTAFMQLSAAGQGRTGFKVRIHNAGSETAQSSIGNVGTANPYGQGSAAPVTAAMDTTTPTKISIAALRANTGDTITLVNYSVTATYMP